MLPSSFAASGLPIKVSKAGLDSCEGLSVDAWAERSARALPSPSVAVCCDAACRRLLLPSASASARRDSSATPEFSSSIQIAFERAFSAKRGACCLRTLCSLAHRIGLDGTSCLLDGLCKNVSFSFSIVVVVCVLVCPASEVVVLTEQQL